MIRDARHMLRGARVDFTAGPGEQVETLERYVKVALLKAGLGRAVPDRRPVVAYVNHSRWVATCPNCAGGIAVWVEWPSGTCLDCGHTYPVEFPSAKTITAAEAILVARGNELNMNWLPQDETLADLRAENRAHQET